MAVLSFTMGGFTFDYTLSSNDEDRYIAAFRGGAIATDEEVLQATVDYFVNYIIEATRNDEERLAIEIAKSSVSSIEITPDP